MTKPESITPLNAHAAAKLFDGRLSLVRNKGRDASVNILSYRSFIWRDSLVSYPVALKEDKRETP